ncbi:MAG TPA: right-handed parallel beta-helix repeat-containing protein [Saprospiraceae bacterium]|nr:right-handed parallel beta-helix repeat-containing protein [Saprospiraceae bacterium]
MKILLLPLLTVLVFNVLAQNQRLYVRQNAAGTNDGSSWQNAFNELQDALTVAQAGDTVWVAEGTYYPTSTADRTVSFRVKSGVGLYGGFAGSETALADRDWEAHPVVLSGAIGSIFSSDNVLHILFLENPDSNTVLDGLRFTKGVEDADTTNRGGAAIYVWAKDTVGTPVSAARIRNCRFEANTSTSYGGVVTIECYSVDYTRFERCTFMQNDARFGGAVGISASEVRTVFADCRFVSNVALEGGGAVVIGSAASGVRFSGCTFEKNRTKNAGGGAVSHTGASLLGKGVAFVDCQFLENVCEVNSYPEGGAIYLSAWGGSDTLTIENCTFRKNTGAKAGAVYIDQSGTTGSNFQFRNCSFEENEASNAAAIRLGCSGGCSDKFIQSFHLSRCTLLKNKGQTISIEGSAFSQQETLVRVDSCLFSENQNGAVFTLNIEGKSRLDIVNTVFGRNKNGEVITALASQTFLTNCIIEENKQAYWLFSWEDGTMNLRNCLFRKNQTQDFLFGVNFGALSVVNCHFDANAAVDDYPFPFFQAEATVSNSVFTGNTGTPYAIPAYLHPHFQHCYFDVPLNNPPATVALGPGILTGFDPMFGNAVAGDFHLQTCSPLIGAGNNDAVAGLPFDLDGTLRIQGGTVDIGIFEKAAPNLAVAPLIQASCPGDPTGSIAFEPENGCAPYTVAWSSGIASGQNLTGLAGGNYVFTITDASNSVFTLPVTIPEKPPAVLDALVTPVPCGDTLGGSAILAATGASPFSFLWADGANDSVRTGMVAGIYPLAITDAGGCKGIDTVEITTQGRLKASIKIDKITCPGFADGKLIVTPKNGLPPFHWLWETGDTTAAVTGLGPGLYHITLTDALGCTITYSIPLVEPDVDCKGAADVVFPNPFSEYLIVRTESVPEETSVWILMDVLGRELRSVALTDYQTRLDFPDLPAGMYYWQLWHDGTLVQTGKVQKI